jgi:glycerol-3-phosphate dehydrogenase
MNKILRDPAGFAEVTYDLIIIGGGIYGVMLAFEASQRGFKSLLLEKADFGGATTFNCLRIIHGGLRYLQTLDLHRFYESVAERKWFLKTYPDLVEPLSCLMPLYNYGVHRSSILRIATLLNDFLSRDRNRDVPQDRWLADGKMLSASETRSLCSLIEPEGLKAGVIWNDAFIPNSQRILMESLRRSCGNGASALNYVEAQEIVRGSKDVSGVLAKDLINNTSYEFRSSIVINATGPWSRKLAVDFDEDKPELFRSSIAWNVLFDKPALSSVALAVRPRKPKARTYFLIPWHEKLLAGTGHAPWSGNIDDPVPDEQMILEFIADLNLAVPSLNVKSSDIRHIFSGLLPVKKSGGIQLASREVIVSHADTGGPRGLYSVSGVKFTTSRLVAQKMMQMLFVDRNQFRHRNAVISGQTSESGIQRGIFRLNEPPAIDSKDWRAALKSIVEDECVQYPDDLVFRRTNIWESPETAAMILPQIQDIIKTDKV